MGGRIVTSPTARGWRIRRRWRGRFPPDEIPIHAVPDRRWLVEATCLGIPERWAWQVAGRHARVRVAEEVATALAPDDPSPVALSSSSTCRRPAGSLPNKPWS
jgi:hypothetical protein